MSNKGFVNKAKSGTRALPTQWRRAAEKARLAKGEKPAPEAHGKPSKKRAPTSKGTEADERRDRQDPSGE